MHRTFRKYLDDATGISEFVFAINLDIRGFSDWSLTVDSAQTALFVKKIYARLIDKYFTDASYFKPTGDGLLIVMPFKEEELGRVATRLIEDAMAIVSEFDSLCANDQIINFQTPQDVGIGLARGPASRLASRGKTLDYSGRVLNLASRLMDLARPRGVIFDSGFGYDLLPEALKEQFTSSAVYLRGVSPNSPMSIFSWPADIEVPDTNRHPLGEAKWESIEHTVTRDQLEEGAEYFLVDLDVMPIKTPDPELTLNVEHVSPTPSGRKSRTQASYFEHPATFVESAGEVAIEYSRAALARRLSEIGPKWPVLLTFRYRSR